MTEHCEKNSLETEDASVGLDLPHTFDSLKNLNITGDSSEEKKEASMPEMIQKALEGNSTLLSLSPQALIDAYRRKDTLRFQHNTCKEMLVNLEFYDYDLGSPEYLEMVKGLEIVLRYIP